MTKRSALVGAALLGALAIGGLWFVFRQPPPPPIEGPAPSRRHHPASVGPGSIEASESQPTGAADAGSWLRVVRADTRQPIAGARLQLSCELPGGSELFTDDGGYARFGGRLSADCTAAATAPYFEFEQAPALPQGEIALSRIAPWRGRVLLPSGEPAAGALVTQPEAEGVQARTGLDGRFVLEVANSLMLVAERDGLFGTQLLPVVAGEEIEIVLQTPVALSGVVRRSNQEPLAGVEVDLRVRALHRHVTTGADGQWAMPLPGPSSRLTLSKPGFVTVVDPPRTHEVILYRPAVLRGRLVTVTRAPVPGATVSCEGAAETSTGPDGRFSFTGLSGATVELEAELGEATAEKTVPLIEDGVADVELVLPPPLFAVPVVAVDEQGRPLRLPWGVVATPEGDLGWDSRGNANVPLRLAPGRFHLVATVPGRAFWGEQALVLDGPPPQPVRITLRPGDAGADEPPPNTHPLRVRVRDGSGAPVAMAQIECEGWRSEGVSGADGVFDCRVSDVPEGLIQVTPRVAEISAVARVTGKQTEVELTLKKGRRLHGRIVGASGPGPFSVTINSAVEMKTVQCTGAEFTLEERPDVRAIFCAVSKTDSNDQQLLGCTVVDGEAEVTIPAGAPGSVRVRLLDEKGLPLEAPIVYLDRVGDRPFASQGVLTFSATCGTHVLIVNARGTSARAERIVTVRPNETTDLGTVRIE